MSDMAFLDQMRSWKSKHLKSHAILRFHFLNTSLSESVTDTCNTNNTSNTSTSSDASMTSASVSRLSSYLFEIESLQVSPLQTKSIK